MRRTSAVITGASSGIGEAFAEVFAARGFDLVLTARRASRLERIAERLEREHGRRVHVVPCDLSSRGAVSTLCEAIDRTGVTVGALVNSAGFGLPGGYLDQPWPLHETMLQLMVSAPAELTYRVLPGMIDRGYGRIVTVASLAGLAPAGAGAFYGAVKTFAVSFSTSLAREVGRHGVHVTALCPGLTRSEFHHAPGMRDTVGRMPPWMWMSPQSVAVQGYDAVMAGRTVHVTGGMNRLLVALFRYVPRSVLAGVGRQIAGAHRLK